MRQSRIFTDAELRAISDRQNGSRRDSTGIFNGRVKPKVRELFDWFEKIEFLKKLIK